MADNQMQWAIALGTGAFRLGVGTGLIGLRGFGARLLGAEHDDTLMPALLAGFGARDGALGLAAVASTRPGASVARQLRIQLACDVFDAAVVTGLIATGRIPRGRGYALVGATVFAAAADHFLIRQAERPPGLSLAG